MTQRERIARRMLGIVTYILPRDHPAIEAIYTASWVIDDHEWLEKSKAIEVAIALEAIASVPPINGNTFAQMRVMMAAQELRNGSS